MWTAYRFGCTVETAQPRLPRSFRSLSPDPNTPSPWHPDPAGEPAVSDVDHVQLARLITEISWRIDHGRAAMVYELFVDDGEMSLGPEQVLQGRDAIREWGLQIERATWRIRHVSTNMRFVSEGDGAASGISLVTAYMAEGQEPGTTLPWAVGEDHDQFVRTSDGWRLRSRRWQPLFMRPEP